MREVLLLLLVFKLCFWSGFADTNGQDTVILRALMDQWENRPPSWGQSDDPCGKPWEGISCTNSRVTVIKLSTMGIKGSLSGDIGQLSELQSLDLSYNKDLGGPLTPNIGDLKNLTTLILVGCSFSGTVPDTIGRLSKLSYLALNSNQFSGKIPPSLGKLSNLYWLDLADNKLTGTIPISTGTQPGLDLLVNTKHFHFNKNQLSGKISEALFSPQMSLIHVLFDGNQLTGTIPASLGFVQTLEVLRLDRNSLTGSVPSNLNNLTKVNELNLANNELSGPLPDLYGMNQLNYVDLSNNSFDPSESPAWFSELQSLTALIIQSAGLKGEVPPALFSIPPLQQVILDDNAFNGTLDIGKGVSQELNIVSLKNNNINSVDIVSDYNGSIVLSGNPLCNKLTSTLKSLYCNLNQKPAQPYLTSLAKCYSNTCPNDQSLSPQSCTCAYPYQGILFFRAPFFRDITNSSLFQSLEMSLWTKLGLTPGSVYLQDPFFNSDSYLQVQLKLFPSGGMFFNRTEVLRLGFDFSNQTYKPPHEFGPYYFIASPYPFNGSSGSSSKNTSLIIGISVGCALLVIALIGAAFYGVKQKQKAQKAMELSRPFASWSRAEDSGGAPQLKGARWFSFDELKKITSNFSQSNEIGSGGYGKVYRGMLPTGQLIAIKRAQHGSMQGGHEFKTEIELLSRVHHKNLVGLVGFCFEQGEQMLVYEFIPNGTLRDSLSGKSGVHLDWRRRLRIALGSARGLAYLHELADPPIIHRDVKSTNILLDENLSAKVSDFGLSKLVSDSEKGHISTQVKGTLGYLDPEYYMTQQLTEKSDVYSFGVVMLELIIAKPPLEKGRYIVREAKDALDMKDEQYCGLRGMIDQKILSTNNLVAFTKFVHLAIRCVEEMAADRLTMSEVVKEIESMLQSDGVYTNSNSASSSATDFQAKGAVPRHPYVDSFPAKDVSSNSFEYSGGYSLSTKVEPK
ncbi:leucine-rich repeat protein kinase family protein isoform X2 [Carex rostrata]